jgi:hemerythrin superfamily protein
LQKSYSAFAVAAAAARVRGILDRWHKACDNSVHHSLPQEKIMPRSASSKSTSKTSTRARGASTGKGSQDILKMLTEDHKKVKQMFESFEKMKEEDDQDDDAKQMLVELCCSELTVHAQLEEELFYPALRDAIDDMDLLDEAEVEHASAKQLISELSSMQPDDELYDAKFTVLGEYVKHHIEEEEKEIFPKVKKADLDLEAMAEEAHERKQEMRAELGLDSEDEGEGEEETEKETPASKRKSIH